MKNNFECKLSKKQFSEIIVAFPKSEKLKYNSKYYGIFSTIIELLSE